MRGSVLVFWSIVVVASRAWAEPALDKPAFTATPQELLAAAKAVPGDDDVTVLREDIVDQFDGKRRLTDRWRLVAVIRTQKGADGWDTLSTRYVVSRQDRPAMRARVIDANGKVVEADPKQSTDQPVMKPASDAHELAIALPKLSVGAVIEEEIVTTEREPTTPAGSARRLDVDADREIHVTVSAPLALGLHRLERPAGKVRGSRTVANGVETWSYTLPRRPSIEPDKWVPGDVHQDPWLAFSAVASWAALAHELRAIEDRQLAAGPITLPAGQTKGATLANARALTAWLQHQVRQSGEAVDAMPFAPAPPAETLRTGTADDLSLALTLVALLRQAEIPADLALVDLGAGPDADPDLPMYGYFDHAVVRARIANADVWIDPTADAFRAGVLPWAERHRRALVIAPSTTGLTPTPAASPADHVVHETRTFEFVKDGGARVTEVKREGGMFEGEDRAWFRDQSRDDVTKELDRIFAKRYLVDKIARWSTTDPADLATPFEGTVVVEDAGRATAERDSIDAWVFASAALTDVPAELRAKDSHRQVDFEWYRPHVYEVENRFVIPDGYAMPAISDETRALGAAKLIRTEKVSGQVLTVLYRFESGKLRLTPAEVDAMRDAIVRVLDESRHLVFPSTVHALFERGKVREALAEGARLIAAHPKVGKFHAQLAELLIDLGLGDAARREARAAVQLEPTNADVHAVLGWVLAHDTIGRMYVGDYDHAGARAALERARKLQPDHLGAAAALGELLERDPKGHTHEAGADLAGALQAWRAAFGREDSDANAEGVMRSLLWLGKGDELVKFARARPAGGVRDTMLVAGVALSAGVSAAQQEAGGLATAAARKAALGGAGGVLMLTRHYPEMLALLDASGAFPQGSSQATLMHALRRVDKPLDRKTPLGATIEAELEMAYGEVSKGFWDAQTQREVGEALRAALAQMQITFTRASMADLVRSATIATVEGDAKAWRIDVTTQGAHGSIYAVGDRGTIKIIGTNAAVDGVGRHLLRLTTANDLPTAQRLLDWLAKDAKANPLLQLVWGPNHATDRGAIELAGAVLAGSSDAAHVLPIVEKCDAGRGQLEVACSAVVFEIDTKNAAWKDLDAAATARLAAKPGDRLGTVMKASAQLHLGNPQEADRLATAGLAVTPDDPQLQQLHARIPAVSHDLVEATKRFQALASTHKGMLNDAAWMQLIANIDVPDALAKAQQAVQQFPKAGAVHHTVASLEAEVGDLRSAAKQLREAVQLGRDRAIESSDWYVIGRIAEQVGYRADALAAYHRVTPEPHAELPSSYDLAQRRLAVLGAP
jgi:tetratricopeptide (TPR) repeat protein